MAIVTENKHLKKLNKYNLKIQSKFKSGDKILYRNSDKSNSQDVNNGIILEKNYFKNNVLLKSLAIFNPSMTYSYVLKDTLKKETTCPNCGYSSKTEDFVDCCPYCGTNYNINYLEKKTGNKDYYNRILNSNIYKISTLAIDLLVSFAIVFIYIYTNSRTFNIYDFTKVILYTLILGLFLYYVFYFLDAIIVLYPIKKYMDRINKKNIAFWNKMKEKNIIKSDFFNNFCYELDNYFYSDNSDIVDYDIIDYLEFNDKIIDEHLVIEVKVNVRIVSYLDNKIKSESKNMVFKMVKALSKSNKIDGGVNIIECPGCGHSINVEDKECSYCKKKINYLQEWYLIK